MTTNADIMAECLEDRRALAERVGVDHTFLSNDISKLWPLLVFDHFLHLHCTHRRTEQYRRYGKWIKGIIVAGVRATEEKQFEQQTLAVTCPNCGDPAVSVPIGDLDSLHCGMCVDCPECGERIVFGVFTTAGYQTTCGMKENER